MKAPTLFRTIFLLFIVDVALRTFGYARVIRRLHSIRAAGKDAAAVAAVHLQVLRATAVYPGRSLCLEQSVATAALLRWRGIDAHVRLAVQHYPFAAHAWVEIDRRPVTEEAEVVSRFVLLPEVAA